MVSVVVYRSPTKFTPQTLFTSELFPLPRTIFTSELISTVVNDVPLGDYSLVNNVPPQLILSPPATLLTSE